MRHAVHATADEIYHAVNRSDLRASRATVYNCLALAQAGMVREVHLGGKSVRFDARPVILANDVKTARIISSGTFILRTTSGSKHRWARSRPTRSN